MIFRIPVAGGGVEYFETLCRQLSRTVVFELGFSFTCVNITEVGVLVCWCQSAGELSAHVCVVEVTCCRGLLGSYER